MPVKTFTVGREVFITDSTKCACCGHKFRYSLPVQTLMLWENMCAVCAPGIEELPAKGKTIYTPLDFESWD